MRKAGNDVRSARRAAGASNENDRRAADRQMRADESYPWGYQASSDANAFMTPDHGKQQTMQRHQQQRQDCDWHYQETPPAQMQHSRQPTMYRQHAEKAGGDGDGGDADAARGFKTPEPDARAARRPPATHASANNHSTTHTSDGEQQYQTAAEFAQSQYRRRNRLEKRLEELQKDVASLTLKLRSSSNRSNSTGYLSTDKQITSPPVPLSEVPLNSERVDRGENRQSTQMQRKVLKPPSPAVKIKKTRADKPRTIRSNLSEHSTTPTKGRMSSHVSVSTMRELHKATTERDQLRFELEKMKRTLTTTEKKYEEAMKAREALEKLKAHCESLQESLDLSEKIRMRQKKLLQQLQLNQQQDQAQAQQQQQKPRRTSEAPPTATALRHKETPAVRPAVRKKEMSTYHPTSDLAHDARSRYSTQQYQQHPEYDILDSLVNQRPHPSNPRASTHDHQRLSYRAPATSATTRSTLHTGTAPPPRVNPATAAANGFTYADFDSLLQKVHSPHPYTMMTQPSAAAVFSGKQQSTRLSRRDHQQSNVSAANPPGTGRIRSKSQGPPTTTTRTRPTSAGASSTKAKRSSSLLAPTQASLQRMYAQQRRPDEHRRPFI